MQDAEGWLILSSATIDDASLGLGLAAWSLLPVPTRSGVSRKLLNSLSSRPPRTPASRDKVWNVSRPSAMAGPGCTHSPAHHVHDELYDAGYFLDRSAYPTEPPRARPQSFVDPHGFLFFVSITPFSTALLAEFTAYRIGLLAYWLNILFLGSALYV